MSEFNGSNNAVDPATQNNNAVGRAVIRFPSRKSRLKRYEQQISSGGEPEDHKACNAGDEKLSTQGSIAAANQNQSHEADSDKQIGRYKQSTDGF
jgi:hypothetical protein